MKHSEGKTIKYGFDCGKKLHIKISKEYDGTYDIRIPGEKNGTCEAVLLNVIADTWNISLKRKLTIDDIIEIAKGHICQQCVSRIQNKGVAFRSCMDTLANDLKENTHG